MGHHRFFIIVLLLLSQVCSPIASATVSDEEVGEAIDRIKQYLYYKQDQTGSWEFRSRAGGLESDLLAGWRGDGSCHLGITH